MKRCRFPLQALLTVRQRREQEALEQYAQALLERRRVFENLQALQQELARAWEQSRRLMQTGGCAAEVCRVHAYNRSLEQLRDEFTLALAHAERRVNAALHDMLRARRERELVERCRDKQQARHTREQDRRERRFLDEIAVRLTGPSVGWRSLVENPL